MIDRLLKAASVNLFSFIFLNFPQGHCIHTITKTAGRRAVLKNVAQVGVTGITQRLDTLHAKRAVCMVSNCIFLYRLRE